jgi:hypothetical protein
MSLLQYIDSQLVTEITGESVDESKILEQAERDIEAVLPIVCSEVGPYLDPFNKALSRSYQVSKTSNTWTDTSLTIPLQGNGGENLFQYTVIEMLEADPTKGETKKGKKIPVISSHTAGNTMILFFETVTGLEGVEVDVLIYQPGKMPFHCDYNSGHKRLNYGIQQAVAWQAQYLASLAGGQSLGEAVNTNSQEMESESIGENYQYKKRTGKAISTINERIAPKARDALVSVYGYDPTSGVAGK